jgi:predicted DNA-binding mobile mystery protein A
MSGTQMSRRLGVTRQGMLEIERSEAAGTITINSLRKAADALDCELVYALVPRTSLAHTVASRARQVAERDLKRVGQTMALEDQASTPQEREELLEDYIREHVREKDLWNLP